MAAQALVATQIGWRVAFGVSAALAAAIALGFPPRRASPGPAAGEASSGALPPRRLLERRWAFLLGAYFMFGAGYIAYSTFAGTRLAASDASIAAVSALWIAFGAAMIAGMALSVPVLRWEGRHKRALTAALAAGALGSLASWTDMASAAAAGAVLVGLGLATPTIVSAYARERCSGPEYAHAFSYATAAMGIGQLIGPLAAGALADRFGVAAVALFACAAYALGTVLAALDAVPGQKPGG
jgi:predicted MFS family arabinose efflux permease